MRPESSQFRIKESDKTKVFHSYNTYSTRSSSSDRVQESIPNKMQKIMKLLFLN